jgi:hypothetical protein
MYTLESIVSLFSFILSKRRTEELQLFKIRPILIIYVTAGLFTKAAVRETRNREILHVE